MGRLDGEVAIVTGAARGIGAGIARRFVEEGAAVLATDVLDAEGERSSASFGGSYVHLDVTEEHDWEVAVGECCDSFGSPTILINNAGVVGMASIEDERLDRWRRIIEVNLTGVFLGMRIVIPLMRAAGGGAIVNTSSIWGLVAAEGAAAYHASKGGVTLLTRNAAVTYAADRIRVNSIHPGGVQTAMIDEAGTAPSVSARTPLGRIASAAEIADAVVYLASPEASFVTGAALTIDGGYTAL